jgi:hypothetical protein
MPIINSYPQDIDIQDKDAWIGTDYNTKGTKQYTAEAVTNYLNRKGKVSIAGQITYKFVDTPFSGQGTMTLSPNNGTSFSAITGFKISKDNLSGKAVVAYLEFLTGQEILIADQNNPEKFGHYTINSYTVDPDNDKYYILGLSFLGGNGSIVIDNFYNIVNFSFVADKHFVFTQASPATAWGEGNPKVVNHGLNKYPSVTIVDSAGTRVIGDVQYIDKNNITITFINQFSGKAFLN